MENKYSHAVEIRYLDYRDHILIHRVEIEDATTISSPIDNQLPDLLKQIKDLGFALEPVTRQRDDSETRTVKFIPGHRVVDIDYVFINLKLKEL